MFDKVLAQLLRRGSQVFFAHLLATEMFESNNTSGGRTSTLFSKSNGIRIERLTIAVECKNWKSGLDRQGVQAVYLDYKPLLGRVDGLSQV
jgi:hypothetical protein